MANGESVDVLFSVPDDPAAAGLAYCPVDILEGDAVGVSFYDSALLDRVAIAGQVPINPDGPGEVQ